MSPNSTKRTHYITRIPLDLVPKTNWLVVTTVKEIVFYNQYSNVDVTQLSISVHAILNTNNNEMHIYL